MNTKPAITAETEQYLVHYLETCDPLLMMNLLMELGRTRRHDLTDEDYRQIAGCHNLLSAISRDR